jgi:hypothetical protein
MTQTKKVIIFIATIVVVLFLNMVLMIYESKTGLRLSRWLTFIVPTGIAYFVIFKSGNDNKPKNEKSHE